MRLPSLLASLALVGCADLPSQGGSNDDLADLEARVAALEEDAEADRAEIATLKGQIAASRSEHEALGARQDALDADLGMLEADAAALKAADSDADDRIAGLDERVGAAEEDLASQRTDLTGLAWSVGALATAQDGTTATVADLDASVAALSTSVAGATLAVGTLSDGLTALAATSDDLAATVASHATHLGWVDEQFVTRDATIAGHADRLVALEDGQASQGLAHDDLATTVSGLATDLSLTSSRVSDLLSADESFSTQIASLQANDDTVASTLIDHTGRLGDLETAVAQLQAQSGGAGAAVTYDNYLIYFGSGTEGWQTLNLGPFIGMQPALVVLEVDLVDDVGSGEYFFRDLGATYGVLQSNAVGATQGYIEGAGTNFVVVATDDMGRLEWNGQFTEATIAIRLVAHVL